jgi:hypothetical protein
MQNFVNQLSGALAREFPQNVTCGRSVLPDRSAVFADHYSYAGTSALPQYLPNLRKPLPNRSDCRVGDWNYRIACGFRRFGAN